MKWFKHDSDANRDTKLKKIRIKYGMEGYGLYWYLLELIVDDLNLKNVTFELDHDAELIAHDTGIHYERVQEMMTYMVNLGLFENHDGVISNMKLKHRLDQSMTSNRYMRKMIQTMKESHDGVMTSHDEVKTSHEVDIDIDIDKRIKKEAKKIDYPPELNLAAWQEYLQYRRDNRLRKLKPQSEVKQIERLIGFGNHTVQQQCINETIANGWTGIFEPKQGSAKQTNADKHLQAIRNL